MTLCYNDVIFESITHAYKAKSGGYMPKVKIRKKLPKGKIKIELDPNFKASGKPKEQFKDNYLNFYDDIKVSSKRYDW